MERLITLKLDSRQIKLQLWFTPINVQNQCDEGYKIKKHLERHIQAVHIKDEFQCEVCDKKFVYKTNLRRHKKTCH